MQPPPNILIFMTDQEQAQVTFPGHPCQTPNADRLAAEGLRFRRCYTPAAHCCPSRATFQTGLMPSGHGVVNNVLTETAIRPDIHPQCRTFGQALAEGGYRLTFSGKWHVSRNRRPADDGWEEHTATAVGAEWHSRTWEQWRERAAAGHARRPAPEPGLLYRPGWGSYRHYGTAPGAGPGASFTSGDYRVVTAGVSALDGLLRDNRPWCAFIGPVGPHDPYIIPEKYATMYNPDQIELPASFADDLRGRPAVYQRQRRFWDQMTEPEQRAALAHYWGYCTMEDDLLGLVLDRLDASGQAGNTLVLFLSDHGDYGGAHGLWMKGVPAFDEAYRIPCIMRWPAGIERPGREIDEFVTLADFAPTFAELAGVPLAGVHGKSLRPFFYDELPAERREALVTQFNGVELYYSQRAVLTRDWKYVFNGFDWDELYDLRADPHEMHNLAGEPGYEPVIEALCCHLWRESERTGDITGNPYGTVALCPFGPMSGL